MPFAHHCEYQPHAVKIGDTMFEMPDDPSERVNIFIYLAAPKFNSEKMTADFSSPEVVRDLKSVILQYSRQTLEKLVLAGNGNVQVTLNGQAFTLKHKEHFFIDARDKMSN